jgi:hypothetical protein
MIIPSYALILMLDNSEVVVEEVVVVMAMEFVLRGLAE